MVTRIFFFFAFILGIELYAFQAYLNVFGPSVLLASIYFGAAAIVIASILVYFNFEFRRKMHIPRQLLMANFFLLFIPNLFISLFMIAEDTVRILKIIANGILSLTPSDFSFGVHRSVVYDIIALCISGFLMLAFVYGAVFNVYNYKIRKVNLKLLRLPAAFNGLRVVQISDIHSGSLSDKKAVEKAVHKINALEPDLVFFTGDLVNNIAAEAVAFVDIFSQIKAKYGVFSILGNHDYGDYMYWKDEEDKIKNLETLKSLHEKMGWRLLMNEHVHIEKNGEKIIVAGVENWSASGRFHRYGKLKQALDGIQEAFTVLLLSHDPSHWEGEILQHPAHIDVTFSGHTHGMQFGFEFMKFRWSPVKYFYRQWAGLYAKADQYLYVNRGFGVIGYPGRVGILPEITLFTLESAGKH